jgi:hypothetical protein
VGVGFDREPTADITGRDTIPVAVKAETEIGVNQSQGGVAIVGIGGGQRPQAIGPEPLVGTLAGFPMQALVGNFGQPLASLAVDIGQVSELAEGPEVLADIADATPLDFAFFPGGAHMTSPGVKVVLASEGQKAGIEADDLAVMLEDGAQEVVIGSLAGHASHEVESMLVAACESLIALAVGELQIQTPAVTLDQAKRIQLALVALVVERSEVAPIDLKALARFDLDPQESARSRQLLALGSDILVQNGSAAAVTQRRDPLAEDHTTGRGILAEQICEGLFVGIEFAGTLGSAARSERRVEILLDGPASHVEMTSDFAD